MLVFFDESGDPGMKFDGQRQSSLYFTVAAVIFKIPGAADRCIQRIVQLRSELGLARDFEFHFCELSDRKKAAFLDAMKDCDFCYYGFVTNKRKLWSDGFSFKESLYMYPARLMFANMRHEIVDAKVVLDKCGNREFTRRLGKYLKRHAGVTSDGAARVRKVVAEKSHNNPLLQLADMVCGTIARCHTSTKRDRTRYRDLIRSKERLVRYWPED